MCAVKLKNQRGFYEMPINIDRTCVAVDRRRMQSENGRRNVFRGDAAVVGRKKFNFFFLR